MVTVNVRLSPTIGLADALFDDSPIPMYVCERRTRRILAANAAAARLYGYSREQLCSMTTFDLRPPDEHERLRAWIADGDEACTFADAGVWRHVRADGETIAVEITSMGGIVHDGYSAVLALVLDVTEREHRQRTLMAYKTAIEEAGAIGQLGTLVTDSRTGRCHLTGLLARMFRTTELSLEDYRRITLQVTHHDSLDEARRLIEAAAKNEPYDCELQAYLDGEPRWIHARRSVLRDSDGRAVGSIGIACDITARKEETQRLRRLAFVDRETGLSNWNGILEGDADRGSVGALMLVRFAWLATATERLPENRRKLVRSVAAKLRQITGDRAQIVRYAKETFAVLLPDRSRPRPPVGLARRIALAYERPISFCGDDFYVVPAIAVCARTDASTGLAEMAARAEAALEEAQRRSPRIAVYCDELQREHDRRVAIEQRLRCAVSERTLGVAYQPIVALPSGAIVGAEALMRWDCPGIGPVPPTEFIAAAEATGTVLALGDWILREACAQAKRWELKHGFTGRLAVNVSAVQVEQRDFVKNVVAACRATNLSPARLELEVTERVMLGGDGCGIRNLEALRRLGVRIAIDDFGTGYSSLSTFAMLPLDTIKLDRTFVESVAKDGFQADMVQAIINLGHRRRLTVVAEGIERPAQSQALSKMGCDEAQGFLFSHPMSADDLDVLLSATEAWREQSRGADAIHRLRLA